MQGEQTSQQYGVVFGRHLAAPVAPDEWKDDGQALERCLLAQAPSEAGQDSAILSLREVLEVVDEWIVRLCSLGHAR
jgi:hypothetical protein